ncbi:MAG: dihydroorotate dehydrogenase electron transfer subunit [Armatimonadota bacterium]
MESTRERIERFRFMLSDFGCVLGYDCAAPANGSTILWKKPGSLHLIFRPLQDRISVDAALPGEADSRSPWGSMTYANLERALAQWCAENPKLAPAICQYLHPSATEFPAGSDNGAQCLELKVISNRPVCPDHYLMHLKLPRGTRIDPQPGQFFHVLCDPPGGDNYPLTLRRPFSIHGAAYQGFQRRLLAKAGDVPAVIRDVLDRHPSEINFLYRVVGVGTRYLTQVKAGSTLDLLGPCGHGFRIGPEANAVIVAGGIGAAPLVPLAESLRYHDRRVHLYQGALHRAFLAPMLCRPDQSCGQEHLTGEREFRQLITEEFREIGAGDVHICTDDGSEGEKGYPSDILAEHFSTGKLPTEDTCIYACGPRGMLRAVAAVAGRFGVKCQVSMEEHMACGIGACMSCTCATTAPDGTTEKKRVCKEGPVFDAREIQW